ncbi:hypothetical protein GWL_04820 [Herbaspirillum sp. GW103]|nr:hypothetical protein GWL_04820 [Herbaspirillum sp. GW103]
MRLVGLVSRAAAGAVGGAGRYYSSDENDSYCCLGRGSVRRCPQNFSRFPANLLAKNDLPARLVTLASHARSDCCR